jgi:integral membrane protein (TIGR01906 family)
MTLSKSTQTLLSWLTVLLVLITLVLLAVRLLIFPLFPALEYRMPGFPADPYGFTLEQRLEYSRLSVQYLTNDADISFLSDLRFPEGQQAPLSSCRPPEDCTRLFNERELGHMLDVKNTVKTAMWVLNVALLLLLGFAFWAWRGNWAAAYQRGLERGGWLTVIVIVAVLLFVILAFNLIFVLFHQVFFQAGTWTFPTSDTLIRLFPERFWQDTFLALVLLAGGLGTALALLMRKARLSPAPKPAQKG